MHLSDVIFYNMVAIVLKSPHHLTILLHIFTIIICMLIYIVSNFGIIFPDNAVFELLDIISRGEVTRIILAVVLNIINPLVHFLFWKKYNAMQLLNFSFPCIRRQSLYEFFDLLQRGNSSGYRI